MTLEHLKTLSSLMTGFRQGCVCHISNEKFAEYVHQGLKLIHEYHQENSQKPEETKNLLSFLTFLRSFTKFTLLLTNMGNNDDILCKRLHSWLLLIRKLKIYILKGLLTLTIGCSDNFHLLNLSRDTFNHVLTIFPCPLVSQNPEEGCKRLCQPLLVKLETPTLAALAKLSYHDIEAQVSKLKKGVQMNCSSGIVLVSAPCNHYKDINNCLLQVNCLTYA